MTREADPTPDADPAPGPEPPREARSGSEGAFSPTPDDEAGHKVHGEGERLTEHTGAGSADGPEGSSGTYRVRIEGFEGPFDLLLQLIARRKVDVSEVVLAEITGEFLAHLRIGDDGMPAVDLDTATHFLVVAATLIELKAARLLPEPERERLEDLLAEARDVLYARLLEYKAFRDASAFIAALLAEQEPYVGREVALDERLEQLVPDTELPVDAAGLASLAAAALAPRSTPRVSVAHLQSSVLTVRDAARRLLDHLHDPGEQAVFRGLVDGLSRAERVVHFVALLELYKLGHVDLEQGELFGPLEVRRLRNGTDLTAIDEQQDGLVPEGRAARPTPSADLA